MSSDRIDFSPLDPKRDPERFERMVRKVTSGVQSASAALTVKVQSAGSSGCTALPFGAPAAGLALAALGLLVRRRRSMTRNDSE